MDTVLNSILEFTNRREWYKNGKLHRINGPAIEYKNGCKKWYRNGILYKECGPDIVYNRIKKKWFINKKIMDYSLTITPKKSNCSICLNTITNTFCFGTTNENFFHEKCLHELLKCSSPLKN